MADKPNPPSPAEQDNTLQPPSTSASGMIQPNLNGANYFPIMWSRIPLTAPIGVTEALSTMQVPQNHLGNMPSTTGYDASFARDQASHQMVLSLNHRQNNNHADSHAENDQAHEASRLQTMVMARIDYDFDTYYRVDRPQAGIFRPSAMVSSQLRMARDSPTPAERMHRIQTGCSANYKGDVRIRANRPANIPQNQNCSVWLPGLPPDISTNELLGAIHNVGKIYASHITGPNGKYTTSAAKITFTTAAAAERFLSLSTNPYGNGLLVRGRAIHAEPDRNRVAEPRVPEEHSRVLLICGPRGIVNFIVLSEYFSTKFEYQVDGVFPLSMGRYVNFLEWRFGSYRCQAKWAYQALTTDPFFIRNGVTAIFGRDPCDR